MGNTALGEPYITAHLHRMLRQPRFVLLQGRHLCLGDVANNRDQFCHHMPEDMAVKGSEIVPGGYEDYIGMFYQHYSLTLSALATVPGLYTRSF